MSKAKSTSTKIQEAGEELTRLKARQTELVKGIVDDLKPLMKDNKLISSLHWTQYSPYFNDGDACIFHVREVRVSLTEEAAKKLNSKEAHTRWIKEWSAGEDYDVSDISKAIKGRADILNHEDFATLDTFFGTISAVESFMQSNESVLEEAFGNHAKVVVTAEGIEVEEYEHD